ncbi:MFS transporter [Nocardia sp. NBC_00511]|uniref:MFS transporter n=1 Tax=Nocardia sp. NBC_00511 TaxID=2903591 RepID=UPI0030E53314
MTVGAPGKTLDDVSRAAWTALTACLLAVFMQMLDLTVVHTAIPTVARQLGADDAAQLLIVTVYGLTFACTLPTAARLGELLGRGRVFAIALAAFAAASTWCGISSSAVELVLARGVAGIAAGTAAAQTVAIIATAFPPDRRDRAFGIYAAVAGLAGMIGPILGGLAVDANPLGLGWRTVFLINVPIAAVAIGLVDLRRAQHEINCPTADFENLKQQMVDRDAAGTTAAASCGAPSGIAEFVPVVEAAADSRGLSVLRGMDLGGAALSVIGLALLVYPLTAGHELGWPLWILVMLGLSVPVLAGFVRGQLRRTEPLVRLDLFGERGFAVGAVLMAVFYGLFTALLFTVSVTVQAGLGWSAARTGVLMLPFAIGAAGGALSSPLLSAWWGNRVLTIGVGVFAVAVGAIAVTVRVLGSGLGIGSVAGPVLAAGLGMGWFAAALPAVIIAGIPLSATGSASGLLPTVQQVGSSVGAAALGMVFFARLAAAGALTAITTVLWAIAALSVALACLTLALPARRS